MKHQHLFERNESGVLVPAGGKLSHDDYYLPVEKSMSREELEILHANIRYTLANKQPELKNILAESLNPDGECIQEGIVDIR